MDFLKEFFGKIAEREPLTFLIVGALFLAIGIFGGYPPVGLVVTPPWQIVSAVAGGLLIIVAVYMASRGETSQRVDCRKCEISITSPHDNETLTPPVTLTGRCKSLPKGYELWVFSISTDGLARYWPQSSSEIKNETWTVIARPSPTYKPNTRRKYGVFLVGKHGQALVRYYKTVGNEISGKGVSSPGIPELTSDIVQCGPAREVTLK